MGVRGIRRKGASPIKLNAEAMLDYASNKNLIINNQLEIDRLIEDYDIKIDKSPLLPEISGKLEKRGDKWTILVNAKHNLARQRYTLAHEFAHYCLHRNDNSLFEDTAFFRKEDNKSMIEYEANQFAAELLMPEKFIKVAISQDILSLKELANKFGVSLIAMRNRLIDLGYKLIDDEE